MQSLGNDNVVDENNLSEGELELSEAVISVNQYIMQPRYGASADAGHYDRHLSSSSMRNNELDQPFRGMMASPNLSV